MLLDTLVGCEGLGISLSQHIGIITHYNILAHCVSDNHTVMSRAVACHQSWTAFWPGLDIDIMVNYMLHQTLKSNYI